LTLTFTLTLTTVLLFISRFIFFVDSCDKLSFQIAC